MPSEPRWLTVEEAVEYNWLAVNATGEPFYVREPAMLDGALASPRNHWEYGGERRLGRLAATLLMALARDHPFQQGNKRTALLCARGFLEMNGYSFRGSDDVTADAILGMLDRSISTAAFAEWFGAHVTRPVRIRNSRRRLR